MEPLSTLGPPAQSSWATSATLGAELLMLLSSVGSTLVGSRLMSTVDSEAPCTASGFGNGSEGKMTMSVLVPPASGHRLSTPVGLPELTGWGASQGPAGPLLSPHPMPTPRTANTLKGKGDKQNSGSARGFSASGICPLGSFSQLLLGPTNISHWHFSSWQGCRLLQPLHPAQT